MHITHTAQCLGVVVTGNHEALPTGQSTQPLLSGGCHGDLWLSTRFFCLTLGSLCHITIFSIYNCCFVRFPTVPSSGCTAVGCLSLLFFYFADQNVQCPLRNLSIPRGHKDCFSQSQDGLTWGLQGTQWTIFSRAPQGLEFVPPPLVSCPEVTTPFLGFLRTTQYLTGKRVKAADGLTVEGWLPQVPFETALVFRR